MTPYVTGRLYPLDVEPIMEDVRGDATYVLLETGRVVGEERRSYLFRRPVGILSADGPEAVGPFYRALEDALSRGLYAAGYFTYEWGYALEPKLHGLLASRRPAGPLAWLGLFEAPEVWVHAAEGPPACVGGARGGAASPDPGVLTCDRAQHAAAMARIKEHIRAGDTYQVNFTFGRRFRHEGRPEDLYLALRAQQGVSYGAVIRNGARWILSLSPELFFRREGDRILSTPMKGTIARGVDAAGDARHAAELAADVKSRAENVMIVDLLRNDIGRLCVPGTVRVPEMFTVERYETLLQMVSTIEGRLAPGVSWEALFRSLFPCGSVTGAPKIRTMQLIAELEAAPRGVYTGAVGFIAPGGRAVLSVAIRTVTLDGCAGVLGIGSGVTIGSDADAEYDECVLKSAFLTRRTPPFALIETLRWDPPGGAAATGGYGLLERHMARLARSAHYFGFYLDAGAVRAMLAEHAAAFAGAGLPRRVRLTLDRAGRAECTDQVLYTDAAPRVWSVMFAARAADSGYPFLYHKTTHRGLYDEESARGRAAGADESIFVNERGEVTEGTRTNVFIRRGNTLLTPPPACGLLAGTLREELLVRGEAREAVLTPADLRGADALYVGNSVRGLCSARLLADR